MNSVPIFTDVCKLVSSCRTRRDGALLPGPARGPGEHYHAGDSLEDGRQKYGLLHRSRVGARSLPATVSPWKCWDVVEMPEC